MKYLGHQTGALQGDPESFVLDTVRNQFSDDLYIARFTIPEFTSLCPETGQPDFAHLIIDYAPNASLIESKSLKLYMGSFRNHGAFHEACSNMIAGKFWDACAPHWLRLCAFWYPRGGIPIDVFIELGARPQVYTPHPRHDYKGR